MRNPGKMIRRTLFVITILLLGNTGIRAAEQVHHYLLFTDTNIARLKEQIKTDSVVKKDWDSQLQRAENLLKRDRNAVVDLPLLGLAYRMTGESRFAERIKQTLLQAISRKTWEGSDLLSRTPPWRAGLGTAHSTFSTSLGFDCIYNYLKPQERKQIAKGIVRLGIRPAIDDWLSPLRDIHTLDNMGHNWWSACVYIAGFASLAVKNEIPQAPKWVSEISHTAKQWFDFTGSVLQNKPRTFGDDGGYYESINYAAFGISQYLFFRYACSHVMPGIKQPDLPVLPKIADFFIYTTYYTSHKPLSVNFGDGSIYKTGNSCVLLLWNLGYYKARFAWYLDKVHRGTDREGLELDTPIGLALNPNLPKLSANYQPDLPDSHLFYSMGWATLRNSWKDNATMLAVKSGFTWNHTHADAGSYILFHNGKNLIIDSGNCSYGNPLYTQYYCRSEAHNVVLWDGKAQNPRDSYFGVVNPGSLHALINGDNLKYVLADATGPTSQYFARNFRSFLWVGNVILVIDDVLAYQPGHFEWLLHYNGQSRRHGLDLSIKEGNAEVLVRPLFPETFPAGGLPHDFPEKMRLEQKMGYQDHHPENKIPYWSISHFKETARTKFITAIILKNKKDEDNLPKIERLEGNNMIGVRITQGDKVTNVYFNLLADGRIKHRNSHIDYDGWKTDAYLLAMTFDKGADQTNPKNIKQIFVGHGSYLRRDNQVILHALSKYTALVEDFNSPRPRLLFDGQPVVNVRLAGNRKEHTILLNGKQKSVKYLPDEKVIEVNLDNTK